MAGTGHGRDAVLPGGGGAPDQVPAARGAGRGRALGQARGRFTAAFEEHAAWLCAQMPWAKAAELLRITWQALQSIVAGSPRTCAAARDRLDGLRRIGIDEKAWRKGHRLHHRRHRS